MAVRDEFAAFLRDGTALALANSTEKAKSEIHHRPSFARTSPITRVEASLCSPESSGRFDVVARLEWLLRLHPRPRPEPAHPCRGPYVAIVEAKNDLIRTGLGQCIAAMVAARMSNERLGLVDAAVHGAVSTGAAWQFLRLRGDVVAMDLPEYFIDDLPKIMGILRAIVEAV